MRLDPDLTQYLFRFIGSGPGKESKQTEPGYEIESSESTRGSVVHQYWM